MIWWLILILPLLFSMIPVHAIVNWRTKSPAEVTIRWLFIKYKMFPAKKKEKKLRKSIKPKKPKKLMKKPPVAQTPESFTEKLGMIVDLIGSLEGAVGFLLRHFKLYKIKLDIIVAKSDAAQTAIAFGRMNAKVYGIYALASNILKMGRPEISIRPNYTADAGDAMLEVRGKLSPIMALIALLHFGIAFICRQWKHD